MRLIYAEKLAIIFLFVLGNCAFIFGGPRVIPFYASAAVVILFGFWQWIASRKALDYHFLIIFILFITIILISELFADPNSDGYQVYDLRIWCDVFAFFFLIILYRDKIERMFGLDIIMYGGFIISVLAFARYMADPIHFVLSRGQEFTDSNYLGVAIALSAIIAFNQIISLPLPPWKVMLFFAGILLNLAVIVVVSSRGAAVTITLALLASILFAYFAGVRQKQQRKTLHLYSFAIIAILIGAYFINVRIGFINTDIFIKRFNQTVETGDTSERDLIFKAAVLAYSGQPLVIQLLGNGTGMGMAVIGRKMHVERADAHNSYLATLMDYGAVGLILLLSLQCYALLSILRLGGIYRCMLFGIWFTLILFSFTLSPFTQDDVWFAFATLVIMPTAVDPINYFHQLYTRIPLKQVMQ